MPSEIQRRLTQNLLEDARRYRWLVSTNPVMIASIAWGRKSACRYGVDQVDKAVDAAMKEDIDTSNRL